MIPCRFAPAVLANCLGAGAHARPSDRASADRPRFDIAMTRKTQVSVVCDLTA
jgi:hypothetical protein